MNAVAYKWRGTYTDGKTAHLYDVEVCLVKGAVALVDLTTLAPVAEWPVAALAFDNSFTGLVQVTSRSAPGAALTVEDPTFRVALSDVVPELRRPILGRKTLFLTLLILVAAGATIFWEGATPMSEHIAHKIPFAWEKKVSTQFKEVYAQKFVKDEDADLALGRLRERLIRHQKLGVDFELKVSTDSSVNAFAMPGGLVVINCGLVRKAESADEVAGVLAHEMTHVTRRHVTAGLVRGAIMTSIWHFTLGDFNGIVAVDPSSLYQLASLEFDRKAETEADQGAVHLLDHAGISRAGFVQFFERLAKEPGGNMPQILSTHPSSRDRLRLVETAPGRKARTTPALGIGDWLALKHACPGHGAEDKHHDSSDDEDEEDDDEPAH